MRFLIIALLFFASDIMATTIFDSNDQLYVWARNGLNVRSGPGTSYEIVDKLTFGDSVQFLSETDIKYNINIISEVDTNYYKYNNETIQPIIFYGRWQKIKTASGTVGYAVNQYLMELKPLLKREDSYFAFPLDIKSIDTIYNRGFLKDGESLNSTIKYHYNDNIVRTEMSWGVGAEEIIEFTNLSIVEVLIIMHSNDENIKIRRNWENEVFLDSDGGFCNIRITKIENKVVYIVGCSC